MNQSQSPPKSRIFFLWQLHQNILSGNLLVDSKFHRILSEKFSELRPGQCMTLESVFTMKHGRPQEYFQRGKFFRVFQGGAGRTFKNHSKNTLKITQKTPKKVIQPPKRHPKTHIFWKAKGRGAGATPLPIPVNHRNRSKPRISIQ